MKNIVGPRIREARHRSGRTITQAQLAARLQTNGVDIDPSAISRIECGNRLITDFEVLGICQVLGISLGSLFGEDEAHTGY